MNLWIDLFMTAKDVAEFVSFLMTPVLAFFAWKMLAQLKIGAEQVRLSVEQIKSAKEISQIQATRESLRLAAEQTEHFAKDVIPMIDAFHKHQKAGKYPILSACVVEESWPNIQTKTDNLPGLMNEIHSMDALVIKILNRMEGIAMFFSCGVADADKAYRPLSRTFCKHIKLFLPYIIVAHERDKHFTYILMLYGSWGMRDHVEKTEKEVSQKKEQLSKITVPQLPTIGTK